MNCPNGVLLCLFGQPLFCGCGGTTLQATATTVKSSTDVVTNTESSVHVVKTHLTPAQFAELKTRVLKRLDQLDPSK